MLHFFWSTWARDYTYTIFGLPGRETIFPLELSTWKSGENEALLAPTPQNAILLRDGFGIGLQTEETIDVTCMFFLVPTCI